MFKRGAFLALSLLGGLFLNTAFTSFANAAANAITQLVPFQARLHNSEGNVVQDGIYDLTFYVYETPTGGEFVWSESHTQVSVIHGYVNVLLGGTESGKFEDKNVDFSTQKYLSISIDGGQEMFPRHQLVPTFHSYNASKLGGKDADTYAQITYVTNEINAVNTIINTNKTNVDTTINSLVSDKFVTGKNIAKDADKLDGHDSAYFLPSTHTKDLVPVGTILTWPAGTLPEGYVECNGQYLSKTTYAALYSILGTTYGSTASDFRVPDYRGLFLRGWAHGYTAYDPDSSRGIGSYQADDFKSHVHGYTGVQGNARPDGSGDSTTTGSSLSYPRQSELDYEGGNETRPKNKAVMYIIKVKSFQP